MIRLAIRCAPELAERVLAELVTLAPSGVEEVEGEGFVEYAVYGPPGELPELPDLRAAAGEALIEVRTEQLADDWQDRWRRFHKPILAGGGRLRVRPSWIAAAEAPGEPEIDLVIDPGRAFGTGAHATTRLCLELLCEVPPAGALADWGTGTGVLAIAAARLGFGPVIAVETERAAIEVAAANATANGVAIEVRGADLRRDPLPLAPTVVANLTVPLLIGLAGRLGEQPARPERLLCSGLLSAEVTDVGAAFAATGYERIEVRSAAGWSALSLICVP